MIRLKREGAGRFFHRPDQDFGQDFGLIY